MPIWTLTGRRWVTATVAVLISLFLAQAAFALAAGPDTYAAPQVVAQAATATPFRFLTPTPFVSRPTTSTTTSTTSTAPRAGGVPLELIVPAVAGGFAAIGGGTYLLRRKSTS